MSEKRAAPPPRKVKVYNQLKNTHSEQLAKLQTKHQQDVEVLDDIRNFMKIRASMEKDFGQALVKLATTYLQKKPPPGIDYKNEDKQEIKGVFGVWRMVLDETEKMGKARLAAADVFHGQISENAKNVRQTKLQIAKRCFDNLRKYQDEVQQTVQEIDKAKKLYFDEEHMAHDARDKAQDAEDKLKKKKGRIFQSITSLQKNSQKFLSRREACDIQSTKARNDYILALAAANAHQERFYGTDLPDILEQLDCDVSEKVKEYLVLMCRTELLTVTACQSSFSRIQEEASKITRQYSVECFLEDNPVLGKKITYDFDPCDNDEIRVICTDHLAEHALSKDAKRWASAFMKDCRVLRDKHMLLNQLYAKLDKGEKTVENISGEQEDIETKIEECKNAIRKAETGKMKAEARLNALREGGGGTSPAPDFYGGGDDIVEEQREIQVEFTTQEMSSMGVKCVAIYSYEAVNPDELSFVENEELEMVNEGDGDGWIRVRNYRGEEGYIPQNYVDIVDANAQASFSSVDYAVDITTTYTNGEVTSMAVEPPASLEIPHATSHDNRVQYCRAIYDYEATCEDELTFNEGQVIRIVRKCINDDDVDDGWWEGEIDGQIGTFPSLVVEELKVTGTPITPGMEHEAVTPDGLPPPPDFAPPKPSFLNPPQQVILTQPTPVGPEEGGENEQIPTDDQQTQGVSVLIDDFRMEISDEQRSVLQRNLRNREEEEPGTEDQVEQVENGKVLEEVEADKVEKDPEIPSAVTVVIDSPDEPPREFADSDSDEEQVTEKENAVRDVSGDPEAGKDEPETPEPDVTSPGEEPNLPPPSDEVTSSAGGETTIEDVTTPPDVPPPPPPPPDDDDEVDLC